MANNLTTPRRRSRREFLQVLGATTALPWVAAFPALAQPPATTPTPAPAPAPAPAPPPSTPDPNAAANKADAQNLYEILQRRYGVQWTEAQAESLREDLADGIASGRTLRKLELRNADEPAVVFVAREPEA